MKQKGIVSIRLQCAVIGSLLLLLSCRDPDPQVNPDFAIEIGQSEIPYLVVDTQNKPINFEPGTSASLKIFEKKQLIQEQPIAIEFRGKTSYRVSDKKGYNLEAKDGAGNDLEVSFFGFPPDEDWRLIGHVVNFQEKFIFDRTLMYNYVAYEISRSIGKYASRCKFVELELNGEYQGVYVFTERIKRNDNRINIKSLNSSSTNITGGYILSIDKATVGQEGIGLPLSYFDDNWDDDARYTSQNSFRSQYDINRNLITFAPFGPPYHANKTLETYFLYEYPPAENITVSQKEYIANYIHQFETALINDNFASGTRTYTNFIDRSTFVDYFIINELCRNVDAFRLSTYLQKDRDGKLAMGPVWDFDIGFDNGERVPINNWVVNYNNYVRGDAWMMPFWWPRLLEDPQFRTEVKQRWSTLRGGVLSNTALNQLITNTATYLKANGAVKRNYDKWDKGIGVNYDQSVNALQEFLQQRASWMDVTIGNF